MITKHEMDIIKNLARNQVRPYVEFDELVNEAVMAVLEERKRGVIVTDGILIAIARRSMIKFKQNRKSPVYVPGGSDHYVRTKGKLYLGVPIEAQQKLNWARKRRYDKIAVYRAVLRIVRKEVEHDELLDALRGGMSVRDIVETVDNITYHGVVMFKETVKAILKKMGF